MGVTLKSDLSDLSDLSDKMGASCYTPWVCGAQCGWARAMSYRWGNYFSSAPQNKNPVFIVFTVFTVSAARRVQQTAAAMQNLGAKIYRRVKQRAELPLGNATRKVTAG